jgi:NTE family protein
MSAVMNMNGGVRSRSRGGNGRSSNRALACNALPGQVVLVLQGGGAVGAFQAGVIQAMHEAGVEPDWVIGTSIGAINGAIIAGNPSQHRVERLHAFWDMVEHQEPFADSFALRAVGQPLANLAALARGIPGFFKPNVEALLGVQAPVGLEQAAYYTTSPLSQTLPSLVDFALVNAKRTRLTLGAVNARTGVMRYFDSRDDMLGVAHVMASAALPPAFPAIRIDGEPYWDGGIYSNTPIEIVLDDRPRFDSVIFAVQLWNSDGPEPESIWQALGRQKEIQYASRATSHVARQKQIHQLRSVITELVGHIGATKRKLRSVRELAAYGCTTTMHVVELTAPRLEGEDLTKDIDFTRASLRARWEAGYANARECISSAPWERPVNPLEGVVIHNTVSGLS